VPAGVPLTGGGGGALVGPPPPQPLIAAPTRASNNTDAANAGLATQARASVCFERRSHKNISSIGSQRIGKRFQGVLSGEEGAGGISNALAVVLTLIATVAGAACVTVTGEAGPLHAALGGAPLQPAVNVS
jgi:hypothetical protein